MQIPNTSPAPPFLMLKLHRTPAADFGRAVSESRRINTQPGLTSWEIVSHSGNAEASRLFIARRSQSMH